MGFLLGEGTSDGRTNDSVTDVDQINSSTKENVVRKVFRLVIPFGRNK